MEKSLRKTLRSLEQQNTRVIIIGENHVFFSQRRRINKLIAKLANPGDVVLLEGFPAQQVVSDSDISQSVVYNKLRFPPYILLQGWDNLELLKLQKKQKKRARELAKLIDFKIFRRGSTHEVPELIFQRFQALELENSAMQGRNLSMIDSVKNALGFDDVRKVFVITGRRHLNPALQKEALGLKASLFLPRGNLIDYLLLIPRSINYYRRLS